MNTPFQVIDVFTDSSYHCKGNPCAVLDLARELSPDSMQRIANKLNYPATSFIFKINENEYNVNWYAPDARIKLCGHGAYASLAYLYKKNNDVNNVTLITNEGEEIKSNLVNGHVIMNMDTIENKETESIPAGLEAAIGCEIIGYYKTANKDIVLLKDQTVLEEMKPDFNALRKIEVFGYSITTIADDSAIDFVSRTIIPHVKQLEDYATGSSHAALFPFWQKKLKKNKLKALQLSSRGGYFECTFSENRMFIKSDVEIAIKGLLEI